MSGERDAIPEVPASLQEPFRTALLAASESWIADLGSRLVSIVLFGSVARRQARPTSDIDLVLVAHDVPRVGAKECVELRPSAFRDDLIRL
jgi:predicted nucleotidyltransferase